MQSILTIKPLSNYQVECVFIDGIIKIAALPDFLNTPAFKLLQIKHEFDKVTNCDYFIALKKYELDLSSDTLWHIGVNKA